MQIFSVFFFQKAQYSFSFRYKRHAEFVVSVPLNTTQSSRSAVPMGRGQGNIAQGSHAVASSTLRSVPVIDCA